jgi:hypothetical protein
MPIKWKYVHGICRIDMNSVWESTPRRDGNANADTIVTMSLAINER